MFQQHQIFSFLLYSFSVAIESQIDADWKDIHRSLSNCHAGQGFLSLFSAAEELLLYFSGFTIPVRAQVKDAYLQFSTYLDMMAPLVADIRAVTNIWTPSETGKIKGVLEYRVSQKKVPIFENS